MSKISFIQAGLFTTVQDGGRRGYQSLGMPITLRGLGAEDCPIDSLARHCCRCGRVGHLEPLDAADVAGILTSAR